jgi:3'-5' exoribonuclease
LSVTPQTSPPIVRVRELPSGDRITGFYLLGRMDTKPKRSGGQYLEMTLQDATGKVSAKMWEGFEEFIVLAKTGIAVKVEATADRYQGIFGLVVSRIRPATEAEVADPHVFLPRSPLSSADAHRLLSELIAGMTNEHLKTLLETVFADSGFHERFFESPAGKLWHHAEAGGLAEHSVTIARVADAICCFYPALNHDLLVTGALLHDIGKIFELSSEALIDYSVDGRLLGHIFMGAGFVEDHINRLETFPPEIKRQLLHIILAHQGDGTMGSPVKPMTLEALVIHFLDELDSKFEAFQRVRAATPEGQDFSDWVRLMERFFYLKSIDDNAATGDISNA